MFKVVMQVEIAAKKLQLRGNIRAVMIFIKLSQFWSYFLLKELCIKRNLLDEKISQRKNNKLAHDRSSPCNWDTVSFP